MNDLSLDRLASQLYFSPEYLGQLFKEETGQTFVKYITDFRMKKAKDLLQHTNIKIADVAKAIGYDNISYFCKLFKSNFGDTPTMFRER